MDPSQTFHCTTCGVTIRKTSKNAHLQSKRHCDRQTQPVNTKECTICMTSQQQFESCGRCTHDWCVNCHRNIGRCPYCRLEFQQPPRRHLSRAERRMLEQRIMFRISHTELSSLFPQEWTTGVTNWGILLWEFHHQLRERIRPLVRQMIVEMNWIYENSE